MIAFVPFPEILSWIASRQGESWLIGGNLQRHHGHWSVWMVMETAPTWLPSWVTTTPMM